MATGPIVIACLLSFKIGVMTYIATLLLLAILQPGELLIFSFTTELLGLGLGFALLYIRRNILIVVFSAILLTIGICVLLYGLKFAVLGPSVSTQFTLTIILLIFGFSLVYSWLWKIISILIVTILHRTLHRK